MQYLISDFEKFIVTGVCRNGERFKLIYSDYRTAMCINLWRGHVWGLLKDTKKRIKLKTVYN